MLAILLGSGYFGWRFIRKHEHRLTAEAELAMPGPLRDRVVYRHISDTADNDLAA
jgi:hypothetical protein